MDNSFESKIIQPEKILADFVADFSSWQNLPVIDQGIIIPNGKIDMQFFKTATNELCISLIGLETKPKPFPKEQVDSIFLPLAFIRLL